MIQGKSKESIKESIAIVYIVIILAVGVAWSQTVFLIGLAMLSTVRWYQTGRDPLWQAIEALVYLRAGLICAGRTARQVCSYYRNHFGWSLEDVRRESRMA